MGGEKNGHGGGAECQGYGPLALGSLGLGPDPGGVVSWEERQRKEREKQMRGRVHLLLFGTPLPNWGKRPLYSARGFPNLVSISAYFRHPSKHVLKALIDRDQS